MARQDQNPIEIRVISKRTLADPELSEMVTRMEQEADEDIKARTVTLRWGKPQIDMIKRAASILGVPYQTYMKQVVFKQALADIAQAEAVAAHTPRDSE